MSNAGTIKKDALSQEYGFHPVTGKNLLKTLGPGTLEVTLDKFDQRTGWKVTQSDNEKAVIFKPPTPPALNILDLLPRSVEPKEFLAQRAKDLKEWDANRELAKTYRAVAEDAKAIRENWGDRTKKPPFFIFESTKDLNTPKMVEGVMIGGPGSVIGLGIFGGAVGAVILGITSYFLDSPKPWAALPAFAAWVQILDLANSALTYPLRLNKSPAYTFNKQSKAPLSPSKGMDEEDRRLVAEFALVARGMNQLVDVVRIQDGIKEEKNEKARSKLEKTGRALIEKAVKEAQWPAEYSEALQVSLLKGQFPLVDAWKAKLEEQYKPLAARLQARIAVLETPPATLAPAPGVK